MGTNPYNFANVVDTNAEKQLIRCACDRYYSDAVALAVGLVPLADPSQCSASPLLHGVCDGPLRSY